MRSSERMRATHRDAYVTRGSRGGRAAFPVYIPIGMSHAHRYGRGAEPTTRAPASVSGPLLPVDLEDPYPALGRGAAPRSRIHGVAPAGRGRRTRPGSDLLGAALRRVPSGPSRPRDVLLTKPERGDGPAVRGRHHRDGRAGPSAASRAGGPGVPAEGARAVADDGRAPSGRRRHRLDRRPRTSGPRRAADVRASRSGDRTDPRTSRRTTERSFNAGRSI